MTDPTPTPAPLSPGTQAVLDAFKAQVELTWLTRDPERVGLAYALRAAASQMEFVQDAQRLHAIAAELEGQSNA